MKKTACFSGKQRHKWYTAERARPAPAKKYPTANAAQSRVEQHCAKFEQTPAPVCTEDGPHAEKAAASDIPKQKRAAPSEVSVFTDSLCHLRTDAKAAETPN